MRFCANGYEIWGFNGCCGGWRYCGDMWWNLVGDFCGGYLWRRNMRAAFWVGNGGVGFGHCSAVAAVEKFKFR